MRTLAFAAIPALLFTVACATTEESSGVSPEIETACSSGFEEGEQAVIRVDSISPSSGKRHGGTPVTIHGKGFKTGATVFIGRHHCTGVAVVDQGSITCFTARHPIEAADVIVANPDHHCGKLAGGFTYVPSVLIAPRSVTLSTTNEITFSAARGTEPYKFSLLSGEGSIDPKSGAYKAPENAGTAVVQVKDSAGTSSEAIILVTPMLGVSPDKNQIPAGSKAFFASHGGVPPYSYSLTSGSGEIDFNTGTFSSAEPGTAKILVTDSIGNTAQAEVTVEPPPPPLELAPLSVRTIVGRQVTFTAKGGVPPLKFSVLAGLGTIDPESGAFTAGDAPGVALIEVTDSRGVKVQASVETFPQLSAYPLSKTVLVGESVNFLAIGGMPPYRFSVTSGKGNIHATSGVYNAPETASTEKIAIADGAGQTLEATLTVSTEGMTLYQLGVGSSHACAVSNGNVKCWGDNRHGQLGVKTVTNRKILPAPVKGLSSGNVVGLAVGWNHACALVTGGAVRCWGDNTYGQLGNNTYNSSLAPVQVVGLTSGVQAIAAGEFHTCAVTNGALVCWGDNRRGQLGNGSTYASALPIQVKGLTQGVQAVGAGMAHTCALISGAVKCWGYNYSGQLGDGTITTRLTPVPVMGLTEGVESIAVGGHHSCATAEGKLKCWGYNGSGQLASEKKGNSTMPLEIPLPGRLVSLALGNYHSCALLEGESPVVCWGYNVHGQAGDPPKKPVFTPTPIRGLMPGVEAVAAGMSTSCARTRDQIQCWGFDGHSILDKHPVGLE